MNQFGEILRKHRSQCRDSENRPLTQERLGELIGSFLGNAGYTGAAVSDWERGKSQIDKDYRLVLIGLLKVLTAYGGMPTLDDANALLEAGNYRSLNEEEARQIYPAGLSTDSSPTATEKLPVVEKSSTTISLPVPADWTLVFLDRLKHITDECTSKRLLSALIWIGVCWLNWKLTFPLLHWPYTSYPIAREATLLYIAGSIVLPALIGTLQRTKNDSTWMERNLANAPILRYYTHLGACMGFHVGYLMIFGGALAGYYLGIGRIHPALQMIAAVWPVILASAAARQTPHTQWLAYGRLAFRDGIVLLVSVPFGLFLGWFFLAFYPTFLSPLMGGICFFTAIFCTAWLANQKKQKAAVG